MNDSAISVQDLGKLYRIYPRRLDRLREFVSPTRAKYHRETWALREVSFELARGSTLGLIGRNGAGKSTALKIIAGKLTPTEGRVEARGRVSSILELGTGFQEALTGRENAQINALFLGQDPWEAESRLDAILEFAGLTGVADQTLRTYSSGMRARLAFAVITTLEPEILLLDEALATGDAAYAEKGKIFLRTLAESGCTILVASHDLAFLVDTCDQLLWLDEGRVRERGVPTTVANSYLTHVGGAGLGPGRPKHALLKLEWAPGSTADEEYALHVVEWTTEGTVMAEHYLGTGSCFEHLVQIAPQVGLSTDRARAGWGPATTQDTDGSTYRLARPQDGPGESVFLALPIPPTPQPVPTGLRIGGRNDLRGELRVSLFVNGDFHSLGALGTAAEELPWYRTDFDLGGLLGD